MPTKRAFSLTEILVVIAILAILAALLFPVFARAKESGRRGTCIVHLRQLGNALAMYESDSGGLPTWSEYWYLRSNDIGNQLTWGGETADQYWDAKLVPYVKSGDRLDPVGKLDRGGVWHCPTSGEPNENRTVGISQGLLYDTVPEDHVRWRYVSTDIVENVSKTIFVGDSGREGRIAYPQNFDGYKDKYLDRLAYYRRDAPWRHDGGAVYVFVDGHAKWRPGVELFPTPLPLGSPRLSTAFGAAHCSMAANFAPTPAQKAYHRKVALDRWNTTCPAE